jgi:uncharacterized protein YbbC (DUF1343 family)
VIFRGVAFTPRSPGDGKYSDTLVTGIRLTITDHAAYDPTLTATFMLSAIRAVHSTEFAFRPTQFDRLAGPELRPDLERGTPLSAIARRWRDELSRFRERRRPFLLYPE